MSEAARSATVTDLGTWSHEHRSANRAVETHNALRALSSQSLSSQSEASPDDALVLSGRAELQRLLTEVGFDQALGVQRLTDFQEIRAELDRFATRTRHEFLSLHSGEPPSESLLAASEPVDAMMLQRKVRLRIAYPTEFATIPRLRGYVDRLGAEGAQFSFVDAVPYRMIISDRSRALVPIVAQSQLHGAIVITEPVIVQCLFFLAGTMLRRGRTLDEIDPGTSSAPTELERDVIRVMSLGLTDDAAAKRLSVSERTFRRYVAQVMTRLGACSRFQAGVRAVERGWL